MLTKSITIAILIAALVNALPQTNVGSEMSTVETVVAAVPKKESVQLSSTSCIESEINEHTGSCNTTHLRCNSGSRSRSSRVSPSSDERTNGSRYRI